ncbi:hypothetical protein GDO86_010623, partial [Hymenochirus boettgeri]
MIVNGFIVVTSLLEWKAKQSLKTTDTVLMCLGLTRLSFNLSSALWLLPGVEAFFYVMWHFLNWSSLWFVSLLSVIYCVKITNYKNCVFIYMKLNISKLLKWLILGNLVTSLVFALLFQFTWKELSQCWINSTESTLNSTTCVTNTFLVMSLFIYYLGSSLPFIMFCITALLVIHSLLSHTQQIRSSGTGLESAHLKAHFSVLKKMVFSFTLYIAYFLSDAFNFTQPLGIVTFGFAFSNLMPDFYTLVHSMFIIYSNT